MSTFHLFSHLPIELRLHIWASTVEPRIVEVRVVYKCYGSVQKLITPTPVPAILQTCSEARNLGLYKQAFSEIADTRANVAEGLDSRYVWLNLDIDMVSIGNTMFHVFEHVAKSIKRLRFEREYQKTWFYHFEKERLRSWVNVEEIHVVCADGMGAWHKAVERVPWPCALENLWFFDTNNGGMMKGSDMLRMLLNEQQGY
ncbi:hypothetical protein F4810DRAFT_102533 [Camillea tinctor]|nr:hypothetical protein F4810DRAFT_102533 [Camillea tinctor]